MNKQCLLSRLSIAGILLIFLSSELSFAAFLTGQTSATLQLNVFYVRHAQSCANVAEGWHKFSYQDPEITNCGVYRSLKAGQDFQKYLSEQKPVIRLDLIGASRLRRTKETAMMMFFHDFFAAKGTLYQLPYIGEIETDVQISFTPENHPYKTDEQITLIKNDFPQFAGKINVDYSDSSAVSINVDYDKFITKTLPKIAEDIFLADTSNRKIFNIAVVTHSNFMSKIVGCKRPDGTKPGNNEVYLVKYFFKAEDKKGTSLVNSPAISACESVMAFNHDSKIEAIDQARCGRKADDKSHALHFPTNPLNAVNALQSLKVSSKCMQ